MQRVNMRPCYQVDSPKSSTNRAIRLYPSLWRMAAPGPDVGFPTPGSRIGTGVLRLAEGYRTATRGALKAMTRLDEFILSSRATLWYKNAMKLWKKAMQVATLATVMLPFSLSAQDDVPAADDILAAMRDMTVSQGERDVMGTIRKGRDKVPFSLSARGDTIAFQYKQDNAWKRFDVRIREKNVDLYQVEGNSAKQMPPSTYTRPIAGTDVCYEDLSLRFLYWKGGKVTQNTSDSRIKGRDCYIVEVPNPNPAVGQFAWVRIWVDKENGTAWQIDGYDRLGKLRKRFTITSVQKLSDGSWFFKQMKLEVRNPENPARTLSLSYLEMDDLPDAG